MPGAGTRVFALAVASTLAVSASSLSGPGERLRVEVTGTGGAAKESIQIRQAGNWVPALSATGSATRVITTAGLADVHICTLQPVTPLSDLRGILDGGDCGVGTVERRIVVTSDPDVADVNVIFEFPCSCRASTASPCKSQDSITSGATISKSVLVTILKSTCARSLVRLPNPYCCGSG